MGKNVYIDASELEAFIKRLDQAAKGDFRKDLELFLQGIGEEFLRIVQDEIIRREVMDTRLLLHSFQKGDENNVWELKEGNLSLEVGSYLDYAAYVNDGHVGVKADSRGAFRLKDGTLARFVPGKWEGDRFIYEPGAKSGMVLREKISDVKGVGYWEYALHILEKMLPHLLEAKMRQWINSYFKDIK